jgi:hypothetical protein
VTGAANHTVGVTQELGIDTRVPLFRSETAARTFQALGAALVSTPIPTSPIAQSRDQEESGLTLLELSLRLLHVKRQAEHLSVIDRSHLGRRVGLDIDLDLLSTRQISSLLVSDARTSHDFTRIFTEEDPDAGIVTDAPPWCWIPVSRHSRQDLAPVIVYDAKGAVIPRMTYHESTRLTVAALIKTFRMLLEATPRQTADGEALNDLRRRWHRARWLIEAAIARLIDHGTVYPVRSTNLNQHFAHPIQNFNRSSFEEYDSIRPRAYSAIEVLSNDPNSSFAAFLELLAIAMDEYPLVVLLNPEKPRAFLTYEAPSLPAAEEGRIYRLFGPAPTAALSPYRTFSLLYRTRIPRAASSYHLTFEAPAHINVRRFLLSSNSSQPLVDGLLSDIQGIVSNYSQLRRAGNAILAGELESVAARLSELGRRRADDAVRYRNYLESRYRALGISDEIKDLPRVTPPDISETEPATLTCFLEGTRPIEALARFAEDFENRRTDNVVELMSPDILSAVARRIQQLELAQDITVDNDPRDHGAHAHWRRSESSGSFEAVEPVSATAYIVLVDDPPSLAGSVLRMLCALLVTTYGLTAALTNDPGWLTRPTVLHSSIHVSAPEALVTVLLLVPGLLLTRLDIPRSGTVLGQLRMFPRALAYAAVALMTTLAAFVSSVDPMPRAISFWVFWGLVVLVMGSIAEWLSSRSIRRDTSPRESGLPKWLEMNFDQHPSSRLNPHSVSFSVTGPERGE